MPPTINDKFGKASIDTDYAIATTVKTTRTAGVTVLEAYDLSKYADDTPVFFVTYKKVTDPVTEITSVVDLVSWKGLVNTAANTLTNLTVAPGYTDLGNDIGDFIECIPTAYWENSLIDGIFVGHNPDGTFKKSALQDALGNEGQLVRTLNDITTDFVQSGGVWSVVAGLNATMTALVAYIDGYRNTVAAIASRAFTISKDTYIDVLHDTGTDAFSIVYTEVANGATAPVLAANSLRLAKVVTNATVITSITQTGNDSRGVAFRNTGAIAPAQMANKIAVGVFSDTGSVGNKQVTGLGFKPQSVEFWFRPGIASGPAYYGYGIMTRNGNQFAHASYASTTSTHREDSTTRCYLAVDNTHPIASGSFVSMDDDGFTVYVNDPGSTFDYIARG